jgi:hypothetical protein
MHNWIIWRLDVWGTASDGWEVNDRSKCGTIELPDDADDADAYDMTIIRALITAGYLYGNAKRFKIDGDDTYLEVLGNHGRPLYMLERIV